MAETTTTTDAPATPDEQPEVVETTATETVKGEVVARPTEAELEHKADSVLQRAADAALAMPGIPGMDEFLSLAMQARMLCLSPACPKEVRNNPHLAFHICMVGRDLNISPTMALNLIDVIPGYGDKPPQLSLSPQLLNGQIRRLQLGLIVKAVSTVDRCIAVAIGPFGNVDFHCKPIWPDHVEACECRDILGDVEFTWEDARMATLVGPNCSPGDHKKASNGRCGCNQGYITYPKRMMWWRASGFAADDFFPEAGLGMYSPEALGAVVDAEGRPIDPATVELPVGYEPAPTGGRGGGETGEAADPHQLWDLQVVVAALPDPQRELLKERYQERDKLSGPLWRLQPASSVRLAEALINGIKASAKSTGWVEKDAVAEITATLGDIVGAVYALAGAPGAPDTPSGTPGSDPTAGDAPTHDEGQGSPPERPEPPASRQHAGEPGTTGYDQIPDNVDLADIKGATPEQVEAAIAEVKALSAREVDKALAARRQHAEGHVDMRRLRLTAALLRERLAEQPTLDAGEGTDQDG